MQRFRRASVALLVLGTLWPGLVAAQPPRAGIVTTLEGTATATRVVLPQPVPLKFKDDVFLQDRITTAEQSLVRLLLGGKAIVTVRERSSLTITEVPGRSTIDLQSGKIGLAVARDRMRPGEVIDIKTPNAIAAVRGTVVIAEVVPARTAQVGGGGAAQGVNFWVLSGDIQVVQYNPATQTQIGGVTTIGQFQRFTAIGTGTPQVETFTADQVATIQTGLVPKAMQHQQAVNQEQLVNAQVTTTEALSVALGLTPPPAAPPAPPPDTQVIDPTTNNPPEPPPVDFPELVLAGPGQVSLPAGQRLKTFSGVSDRVFETPLILIFNQVDLVQQGMDDLILVEAGAQASLASPLMGVGNSRINPEGFDAVGRHLLNVLGSLSSTTPLPLIFTDPSVVNVPGDFTHVGPGGSLALAGQLVADFLGSYTVGGNMVAVDAGGSLASTAPLPLIQFFGTAAAVGQSLARLGGPGATLGILDTILDLAGVPATETTPAVPSVVELGTALVQGGSVLDITGASLDLGGQAVVQVREDSTLTAGGEAAVKITGAPGGEGGPVRGALTAGTLIAGDGSGVAVTVTGRLLDLTDADVTLNTLVALGPGDTFTLGPQGEGVPPSEPVIARMTNSTLTLTGAGALDISGTLARLEGVFTVADPVLTLQNVTGAKGGTDFHPLVLIETDTSLTGRLLVITDSTITVSGSVAEFLGGEFESATALPLIAIDPSSVTPIPGLGFNIALFDGGVVATLRGSLLEILNSTVASGGGTSVVAVLGGAHLITEDTAAALIRTVAGSLYGDANIFTANGAVGAGSVPTGATLSGPLIWGDGTVFTAFNNLVRLADGGFLTLTTELPAVQFQGGSFTGGTPGTVSGGSLLRMFSREGHAGTSLTLAATYLAAENATLASQDGPAFHLADGATVHSTAAGPFASFTGGSASSAQFFVALEANTQFTLPGSETPTVGNHVPPVMTLAGPLAQGANTSVQTGNPALGGNIGGFLFVGDGGDLSTTSPLALLGFDATDVDSAGTMVTVRRSGAEDPSTLTVAGRLFLGTNSTFNTTSLGFGGGTPCCSGFFVGQGAQLTGTGDEALIRLINTTFNAGPDEQSGGSFFSVANTLPVAPPGESTASATVTLAGPLLWGTDATISALFHLLSIVGSSVSSTGIDPLIIFDGNPGTTVTLGGVRTDPLAPGATAPGRLLEISGTAANPASLQLRGPYLSSTGATLTTSAEGFRIAAGGTLTITDTDQDAIILSGGTVTTGGHFVHVNGFTAGGPPPSAVNLSGGLLDASNVTVNARGNLLRIAEGASLTGTSPDELVRFQGGSYTGGPFGSVAGASLLRMFSQVGQAGTHLTLAGAYLGATDATFDSPDAPTFNLADGTHIVSTGPAPFAAFTGGSVTSGFDIFALLNNTSFTVPGNPTTVGSGEAPTVAIAGTLIRGVDATFTTGATGRFLVMTNGASLEQSGPDPLVELDGSNPGLVVTLGGDLAGIFNGAALSSSSPAALFDVNHGQVTAGTGEVARHLLSLGGIGGPEPGPASMSLNGGFLRAWNGSQVAATGHGLNLFTGGSYASTGASSVVSVEDASSLTLGTAPGFRGSVFLLGGGPPPTSLTSAGAGLALSGGSTADLTGDVAGVFNGAALILGGDLAGLNASSLEAGSPAFPEPFRGVLLHASGTTGGEEPTPAAVTVGGSLLRAEAGSQASFTGRAVHASLGAQVQGGGAGAAAIDVRASQLTGGSDLIGIFDPGTGFTWGGPAFRFENLLAGDLVFGAASALLQVAGGAVASVAMVLDAINTVLDLGDRVPVQLSNGATLQVTQGPAFRLTGGSLTARALVGADGTGNTLIFTGTALDLTSATVTLQTLGDVPDEDTVVFLLGLNEPLIRMAGSTLTLTEVDDDVVSFGVDEGDIPTFPGVALVANPSTLNFKSRLLDLGGVNLTATDPQIQLTGTTVNQTETEDPLIFVGGLPVTMAGQLMVATDSLINASGAVLHLSEGSLTGTGADPWIATDPTTLTTPSHFALVHAFTLALASPFLSALDTVFNVGASFLTLSGGAHVSSTAPGQFLQLTGTTAGATRVTTGSHFLNLQGGTLLTGPFNGQTGFVNVNTTVNLPAGTSTLRFAVQDLGDQVVDSAVLLNRVAANGHIPNGNFASGLSGFTATGEVSVVTSVGPIVSPTGDNMALLSTGPDAPQDGIFVTTSTLTHPITLGAPAGVPISFAYNFLSDEFPTFVGTGFDDTFTASVIGPDESETVLATVSVNTALFNSPARLEVAGGLMRAENVEFDVQGDFLQMFNSRLTVGGRLLEGVNAVLDIAGAVMRLLQGSRLTHTLGPVVRLAGGSLNADALFATDGNGNTLTLTGTVLDLLNAVVTLRVLADVPEESTDRFVLLPDPNQPAFKLAGSTLTVTEPGQTFFALGVEEGDIPTFPGVTLVANPSTLNLKGTLLELGGVHLTATAPQIHLTQTTVNQTETADPLIAIGGFAVTMTGQLLVGVDSTLNASGAIVEMREGSLSSSGSQPWIALDPSSATTARNFVLVTEGFQLTLAGGLLDALDTALGATSDGLSFFVVADGAGVTTAGTADPLFRFTGTAPGLSTLTAARVGFVLATTGPLPGPPAVNLSGPLVDATLTTFQIGNPGPGGNTFPFLFVGDGGDLASSSPLPLLDFDGSSVDGSGMVVLRRSRPGDPSTIVLASPLLRGMAGSSFNTTSLGFGGTFGVEGACCSSFFVGQGAQLSSTTEQALIILANATFNAGPDAQSGGSFFAVQDTFGGAPEGELATAAGVSLQGGLLHATDTVLGALFNLLLVQRSTFVSTTPDPLILLDGEAGTTLTLGGSPPEGSPFAGVVGTGRLLNLFAKGAPFDDVPVPFGAEMSLAGPLLLAINAAMTLLGDVVGVFGGALLESTTADALLQLVNSTLTVAPRADNPSTGNVLFVGGIGVIGEGEGAEPTLARVNLGGPLMTVGSTLDVAGSLAFVFPGGQVTLADLDDPFVSITGGEHQIASAAGRSMFQLFGRPTATADEAIVFGEEDVVVLNLGTDRPIRATAGGEPGPVPVPMLDTAEATVSGQKVMTVDHALLEASASLLRLRAGSTMHVAGDAYDLQAKAKVSVQGPMTTVDQSVLNVGGALVRVAGQSYLLVNGDLAQLLNGATLNLTNGPLLNVVAGVARVNGALVGFGAGTNTLNVTNNLCAGGCATLSGVPVAGAGQASIGPNPYRNLGAGGSLNVNLSPQAAVIKVDAGSRVVVTAP